MLGREELHALLETETTVLGPDGEKIGTLGHLLLDARTGEPGFVTVHTGFFGTAESIVPLNDATISRGILHVAFGKDVVRHAPNIDPLGELGLADEDRLFEYYGTGIRGTPPADPTGPTPRIPPPPNPARETRPSGFDTDERVIAVDDEEGRPLLRKYVVTASESALRRLPGNRPHGRHAAPPER